VISHIVVQLDLEIQSAFSKHHDRRNINVWNCSVMSL